MNNYFVHFKIICISVAENSTFSTLLVIKIMEIILSAGLGPRYSQNSCALHCMVVQIDDHQYHFSAYQLTT